MLGVASVIGLMGLGFAWAGCRSTPGAPVAPTDPGTPAVRKSAGDGASLIASFASDGASLLVVDTHATTRVHRIYRVPDFGKPHRELAGLESARFAGRWLVTESASGTIAVEDPITGRRTASLPKMPARITSIGRSDVLVLAEPGVRADLSVLTPDGVRAPVALDAFCPAGLVPRDIDVDHGNDHLLLIRLQCEPVATAPCAETGRRFDGCEGSISRWMFLTASSPMRPRSLGDVWDRPILASSRMGSERIFVGSQPFSETKPAFGAVFGSDGAKIADLRNVPEDAFRCAALSADEKWLAVVMDRTVNVFKTDTGLLHARAGRPLPLETCHAALSKSHVLIAGASTIQRLALPARPELSDLEASTPIALEPGATSLLMPPGPAAVWSYSDHTVFVDLETMTRRDLGEGGWVELDPRGRYLVTGATLWDLRTGLSVADLR